MDSSRPQLSRRVRLAVVGVLALAAAPALGLAGCEAFGMFPSGTPVPVVPAAYPPGMPCIGTCVPDPGSAPVDCNESAGIDTLSIVDFDESDPSTGNFIALGLYAYTDLTAQLLDTYSTPTGSTFAQAGYQPLTQETDLCRPKNYALHVVGGYGPNPNAVGDAACPAFVPQQSAFRGYGGGVGIAMQKLNASGPDNALLGGGNSSSGKCYCGAGCLTPNPSVCPPSTEEYAVQVAALDVSAYDGVSFWARRGPNGQEGIGVTVGDRYTDDDLSFLTYWKDPAAPRHCERVRQCACSNLKPCLFENTTPLCEAPPTLPGGTAVGSGYFCVPPDLFSIAAIGQASPNNGQGSNIVCDVTECASPYSAFPNIPDNAFNGRTCNPYSYENGIGSNWCYTPGVDPAPADPTHQCGDHWMKMVSLDTDWHFYKVPFTDLRQQGFAQKSEHLDLTAVSVVRFTWVAGFVDYWIDEVSFYRNPR
jgi:hypothetical protein